MMLCRDGALSLFCFIAAGLISLFPELQFRLEFNIYAAYFTNIWLLHAAQYVLINIFALLAFHGFSYQVSLAIIYLYVDDLTLYWWHFLFYLQVAIRALFLGYVFGIGILVSINAPPSWQVFGVYTTVLASFHYSEFLAIAWMNPATLSIDSFILNHSVAYGVAACLSWIEFLIERHYFEGMKMPSFVSYFGLILCISGEILRKLAMCTAKHNFNHVVQSEKSDNHELITHGVYNLCRHPSYVGWFYWSIGTQVEYCEFYIIRYLYFYYTVNLHFINFYCS